MATAIVLVVAGTVVSSVFAVRASHNLTEWTRLADARLLDDLLREQQEKLWPAVPAKVQAMERWLDRARDLAKRLPEHEAALAELRAEAKPDTDEAKSIDRSSHKVEQERLAGLKVEANDLQEKLVTDNLLPEARKKLEDRFAEVERVLPSERDRLEPWLSERLTWEFDDPALQWRHEKLSDLVARLRAFVSNGPKLPGLKSVEERLEFARTLRKRTVEDHADAWNSCLDRIAKNPKYAAGTLASPQVGLIPLGPDPDSTLEEFCDTASGDPPVRDDSGRLAGTEQTAFVFVPLPGGSFWMGAQATDASKPGFDPEAEYDKDESPVHLVTLAPFFLSKYEMTQGQWLRVTRSNPSFHRESCCPNCCSAYPFDLRHPVEQVSWDECTEVLSRMGLRLPTEAQWEYGCRAGTGTPWHTGRDASSLAGFANIAGEEYAAHFVGVVRYQKGFTGDSVHPAAVDRRRANGFGLHDMHGNVNEWCADGYESGSYDRKPRAGDGLRSVLGMEYRVRRGGSFFTPAFFARSANRRWNVPSHRDDDLGLRPARPIDP